jgi:hypothetical protein
MPRKPTLTESLQSFAASISPQPLKLIRRAPESWAKLGECYVNAQKKAWWDGGSRRFGWMFNYLQFKGMPGEGCLKAIHHCVWQSKSFELVDVSPFHPDPRFEPLTQDGALVFLIDDQHKVMDHGHHLIPWPSRYYAVSDEKPLVDHVRMLNEKESGAYQRLLNEGQMDDFDFRIIDENSLE